MNEWDGPSVGGAMAKSQAMETASMARMPTLKERIDMAVKQAEERLAATRRARELFDKHPDLEELLNIMQRAHF